MSLAPPPEDRPKATVRRVDFVPRDSNDSPSQWFRFAKDVVQLIPTALRYFSTRYWKAEIKKSEAEADLNHAKALEQHEIASNIADQMRAETRLKNAEAETVEIKNEMLRSLLPNKSIDPETLKLAEKLRDADDLSIEEANDHVLQLIQKIRNDGGFVEIEFNGPKEEPEEEGSHSGFEIESD